MWVIDKQFDFCYGHRVWTQELNAEFCAVGDSHCACRHLHGHQGHVHVFLEGTKLERGMVTDFKHLGWLKNFLDQWVDHRFIIDSKDPMFYSMVDRVYEDLSGRTSPAFINVLIPGTNFIAGRVVNLDGVQSLVDTPDYEVLEGIFIVDFIPTSENLSRWLFDICKAKMAGLGIKVSRVDWYETPKSRSSFRNND